MKRNYNTTLPFLDLLFNTLLCFTGLFALAFILISVEKEKKNIDIKGSFLVEMTWPDDDPSDIDLHVEDPLDNLCFYRSRSVSLLNLAHDDLGGVNDYILTEFGPVKVPYNKEIITIRGTLPGEYTVNVHMYTYRSQQPIPVKVILTKVQPFSIVTAREVILTTSGEEKTAFIFEVDKDGNVTNIDTELEVSLIQKHVENPNTDTRYESEDYVP